MRLQTPVKQKEGGVVFVCTHPTLQSLDNNNQHTTSERQLRTRRDGKNYTAHRSTEETFGLKAGYTVRECVFFALLCILSQTALRSLIVHSNYWIYIYIYVYKYIYIHIYIYNQRHNLWRQWFLAHKTLNLGAIFKIFCMFV